MRSYLVKNVRRPNSSWPLGSAADSEVRSANACVDHYMHLERTQTARSDMYARERDDAWQSVVEAVQSIIDRAEQIKGGRITPRAL